ncbi:MAG: hypothetical protein Q9175_004297 [Cornicularia normoerica]
MSSSTAKTIVLISGANQGIGFEIVKKLATDPNYHILMGTRSLSNGEAAISSLPAGVSVEPIELDVTSDTSIAAAAAVVASKHGRLDVLINNAGIGPYAPPAEASTRERFTQILSTNVTGAACLTDALISLLQKSSQPRIVFVSSAVGSLTQTLDPSSSHHGINAPAYKASKAAMNMLMAVYATTLKEEKWKINSCTPRLSATAFSKGVGRDPSIGAIIACRLASGEVKGTGGFWDSDAPIPW